MYRAKALMPPRPTIPSMVLDLMLASAKASRFAEQVMRLSTGNEIEALLNNEYKNNVPENCFFNYYLI